MNLKLLSISMALMLPIAHTFGQNQAPELSNVKVNSAVISGELTISYDLTDPEDENLEVSVLLYDDKGSIVAISPEKMSGDIGYPVKVGKDKKLVLKHNFVPTNPNVTKIKLMADDRFKINVQSLVDEVNIEQLKLHSKKIAMERHQFSSKGKENLTLVRNYVEENFKQGDKNTLRQTMTQGDKIDIQNIISGVAGSSPTAEVIVLGAHYDAVVGSAGADDNASGVAGLLEIQRILSKYKFNHSIKFIAFDLEEAGFLGSVGYLKKGVSKDEKIKAMVNLDMIGYFDEKPNSQRVPSGYEIIFPEVVKKMDENQRRGDFILNIANEHSKPLAEEFEKAARTYVPDLKVFSIHAFQVGQLTPELAASDHKGFWHTGRMAIHLSDGAETRNVAVNSKKDGLGNINFAFMANVVKAALATVASISEIKHNTAVTVRLDGTIIE